MCMAASLCAPTMYTGMYLKPLSSEFPWPIQIRTTTRLPLPPCVPRRRNPSPPRFLFGRNRAAAKSGYSGGPAAMSFINVLAKWPVRPSHPLSTVIKVGHTWPPWGGNILDRLMEWFSKWKDTVYFRNVVWREYPSLSLSLSSIRSLTFVISCIRKFLEIFDIRAIEIVRFRGNSARNEILDIVSFREK